MKINLFRMSLLGSLLLASSAWADAGIVTTSGSATTEVDRWEQYAVVKIEGTAAQKMHEMLVKTGINPTNIVHQELVVGANLSCWIAKEKTYTCSFILIDGLSEPDVTDGQGPFPGVTVSN